MFQQNYHNNDRRRRGRGDVGTPSILVMSLLYQIYQHLDTLPVKPPATIALLFLNIYPHLYPYVNVYGYYLSDIRGNCLLPSTIINSYQWYGFEGIPYHRLILSAFIHADDYHLYYNMLSLLWKGCNLEKQMTTVRFVIFIIFSLIVSHTITVLLSFLLLEFFQFDRSVTGYDSCAVGFSAVLFAMKYVWNQHDCNLSNIFGINVQSHLGGILTGILFMKLTQPVDLLVNFINTIVFNIPQQRRYTYARGYANN